ncbi:MULTISPECIES: hypothetical protein [unclassified Sphingomonas]|uniref:hypothetical protein n=1 Tax=unclassified Sphingomonas TaxID=196159 RepID=UPI001D109884|nr:hypothetical protein [Sphingomonas sp. IC4-52]MCC2979641.1 hypothetical protein [Sphingomonas sp. IC4-52]MCD2315129.1 hypothetical protein [Sphingomonas sp. IC-11]
MLRLRDTALAHGIALAMVLAASGAQARDRYVAPYIELSQVLDANLSNDDVLTYSQIAVGVDAGVTGRRAEGQVSYRYERRIQWDDRVADENVHTGLARASASVAPGFSLEGGAVATRARADIRGAAPGNFVGNVDNVTQVYSVYAGPSLTTSAGPVQIAASAFGGYTKVESPVVTGVGPGQPRLDYFDDSKSVLAQASAGVAAGTVLPVGVTVSGAYEREEAGQLEQKYEGYYARGDVTLPVSRTVALRAGAGYEKIKATQRDALVDAAGNPVVDRDGRFVTDPASPERIAYNTDGLIYDAGVIWRPSPRFELQANAGYRYGGETYFGSLNWEMARNTGLQVVVYDGIETFGRQLRDGLRDLPTAFQGTASPFGQQFNGCIFGSNAGGSGADAGGCLNNVFQSISTASYRARGIDAVVSATQGRTAYGVGAGYANRRLNTPVVAPGTVAIAVTDESYYAQLFWSRALSRVSQVDVNLFANYYDSGLPVANGVFNLGATGSYSRQFGRLGTIASLGLYTFDQEGFDSQWSAQALLGARYTF